MRSIFAYFYLTIPVKEPSMPRLHWLSIKYYLKPKLQFCKWCITLWETWQQWPVRSEVRVSNLQAGTVPTEDSASSAEAVCRNASCHQMDVSDRPTFCCRAEIRCQFALIWGVHRPKKPQPILVSVLSDLHWSKHDAFRDPKEGKKKANILREYSHMFYYKALGMWLCKCSGKLRLILLQWRSMHSSSCPKKTKAKKKSAGFVQKVKFLLNWNICLGIVVTAWSPDLITFRPQEIVSMGPINTQ